MHFINLPYPGKFDEKKTYKIKFHFSFLVLYEISYDITLHYYKCQLSYGGPKIPYYNEMNKLALYIILLS